MHARQSNLGNLAVLFLLCPLFPAAAAEEVLPLAVHDGRCSCTIGTPNRDDRFLLVVGSLNRRAGPFRVHLRTQYTDGPEEVDVEPVASDAAGNRRIADLHDRLDRARRAAVPLDDFPPAAQPPRQRSFDLFVRSRDFEDRAGYVTVNGELAAVGRHCQVYVDRAWPDRAGLQATVADAVRTFDEDVYPQARARLGRVLDVDRDGRFTLLFTGWLAKLCDRTVAVDGFVRGSDFYRDTSAPYGNGCDMMYLNAALKPGPHLRTLIAHEYTHAVIFSEHVFGAYLPEQPVQDEESWLNEGLAHLNEAHHGYGWSNLDYRMSAFLNAPERYPLVVPDYYGAGVWRSPGHRGAAFLFLRWCEERFGPDLSRRLIQSNLSGTANLEAATGTPFAELFRQWTIAMATDVQRNEERAFPPERLLCGPHLIEMPLSDGEDTEDVAGTAAVYMLLHSPQDTHARLTIEAAPEARLQVSLIRLPRPCGRLHLVPVVVGKVLRLSVTAHDADVTLKNACAERLEPSADRSAVSPRETVRISFEEPSMKTGETRTSGEVSLPEGTGPIVLKVLAVDAGGHRIAGWAVVPLPADASAEHR